MKGTPQIFVVEIITKYYMPDHDTNVELYLSGIGYVGTHEIDGLPTDAVEFTLSAHRDSSLVEIELLKKLIALLQQVLMLQSRI
jgi:hypothetical protein